MLETEEQAEFRMTCRRFAEKEIAPLVESAEKSGVYPRGLREKAGEAGLLAITARPEFGGAGAGLTFQCIMLEECARVCAGITTGLMGLGTRILASFGNAEQIAAYYVPSLKGKAMGAFAMSEPDAGSDVLAMKGRATREGNGWRIRANKMYITGATFADYLLVVAYTTPQARRQGLSIFVVETGTPGVEMHLLDKLGHRSMETASVFLDCHVPHTALLGEEGRGMEYVMHFLEEARITHAARSLGVARAGYEHAVEYAQQRKTFGKTINEYQAIQMKLAQMLIDVTSARLHVYGAAEKLDSGEPAHLEASMAKVVASEAAVSVTDQAMRIFAGQGYMNETPAQRFFRDARLYPMSEGTNEIQMRTIARMAGIAQKG